MKARSIGILTIGASVLLSPLAHAQELDQSLYPPNWDRSFKYGSGIALDENTLVVVDRGYRVPSTLCGIDDGAVHIYRRSSWSAPWPSTPSQTLVGGFREGHFGEHVVLRGNTLIIAESRWQGGVQRPDGAIHYYTRPNANANFSLVQTVPGAPKGLFFTTPGIASNGRYLAAATLDGLSLVHIYKLTPSGLQAHRTLDMGWDDISHLDSIALTDNDVLIIARSGRATAELYGINNTAVFPIDSSALTLTNGPGETDHFYTGQVDVRGTDVVLATKRRSIAAPPNDDTTYALRVFSLAGRVVTPYGEAEIPSDYNAGDGYAVAFRGVEIARGPSVLVNLAGSNTLRTLGFEYATGGQFNLTMELDHTVYNPDAGIGTDTNYTQPVVFDGHHLYVGDIYDMENADQNMCSYAGGSVRIFDTDFGGNPTSICAGEQNVVVEFDPIPGATSFSWYGEGTNSIAANGFSAQVDFASYAAQPKVTMGVNLNGAPWYTTRTLNVTAKACGVEEAFVDAPWWACRGGQDYPLFTHPVAGATAYNWSSPGATNITSTGNTALIDFAPTSLTSTTVRVGINLSVAPYYTERTAVVNLFPCTP
jgi:hypothetical protein